VVPLLLACSVPGPSMVTYTGLFGSKLIFSRGPALFAAAAMVGNSL
jgi:hypothetical protein